MGYLPNLMEHRINLYQRISEQADSRMGQLFRTDAAGRTLDADVADGWRIVQIMPSSVNSQFYVLLERQS